MPAGSAPASGSGITVDDGFVDIDGGRVFVRSWHPARAADVPVLLLHDSLGCVELWRNFPAAMAARLGRTVIAYDRLGFGRSSARGARPEPGFIDEEARLHLPAVAAALGLSRYALFGHSVGGAMALAAAALHPDACAWVVSESAQAFVEPRTREGIRAAQARFAAPGQLERLARWHGDKAAWVLDAWAGVWLSPAFDAWSLDPYLPGVTCPVLALHGECDEYGSEAFPRRIAAGVKGPSRLVILPGCGHVPHRERETEVLAGIAGFVASIA